MLYQIMRAMAKAVGIKSKITNHSLLKKTCQTLLSKEVALNLICQLTVHKNIKTLNNYTTMDLSQQRTMSNMLNESKDVSNAVLMWRMSQLGCLWVQLCTEISILMSVIMLAKTLYQSPKYRSQPQTSQKLNKNVHIWCTERNWTMKT